MAKCAIMRPWNSWRTRSGILLRRMIRLPRRCVFNSSSAVSISPSLVVQRGQFFSRRLHVIEDGGDQSIARFGVRPHPQADTLITRTVIAFRCRCRSCTEG